MGGPSRRAGEKHSHRKGSEGGGVKINMAEVHGDDDDDGAAVQVRPAGLDFRPWTRLLQSVAWRFGMSGEVCDTWVEKTRTELEDVGVHSMRDFVRSVLVVNKNLADLGHEKMSHAVLNMMLVEVVETQSWPD